ncbi:hypothetical protein [Roseibium polysiphoniae]|uniref:Lipoprotein n=1 Tax=Roseibium polysiphoniae TaxID=2571221 RepID=A0ABR9CDU5_9HYPH|nr:hypothetical protein [Roseibium polysiphoniae]MBD8878058.1 hypothetical protein [Roseibium polysiphoniae]
MLRTVFKNLRQIALLLTAGAALAACQAADGTSQAPDTALVAGLMSGLGAVDPQAKPIEYKPRAPLAMPANSTALPEPETQVAGSKSEAWPKNAGNKDLAEIKAIYASADGRHPGVLSPEQMRGINISSNTQRNIVAETRDEEVTSGDRLTNAEMRAQNSSANVFTKEVNAVTNTSLPTRRYLTDPPSAYSVPSADAPMPDVVRTETTAYKDEYDSAPLDMRCLEESGGECRRGR